MVNSLLTGGFTSIEQATSSIRKQNTDVKDSGAAKVSFQDILEQKKSIAKASSDSDESQQLRFSKHADSRLKQRDIILTNEQLSRLSEGTLKAGQKGIKESLVIMDNIAFIVNTQSKTVVTAMDRNMNEDNIYTNIDGAVII